MKISLRGGWRQTSEILFRPLSSGLRPLSFAGLVVLAGSLNPIPSRTRPLNSPAPMVLSLKTWKSRSLPGLPRTEASPLVTMIVLQAAADDVRGGFLLVRSPDGATHLRSLRELRRV